MADLGKVRPKGATLTICAEKIDITIHLYTYTIALQACSRVCVCAMCIGRLGTPLILQKHAHFQNRFGEY